MIATSWPKRLSRVATLSPESLIGVVYGSQARGTARPDSDIDLLVVSPHFDGKKDFDEVNKLWRLTARTDNRVEPVPVGEREWVEDDSRAIVEIARREGQVVKV